MFKYTPGWLDCARRGVLRAPADGHGLGHVEALCDSLTQSGGYSAETRKIIHVKIPAVLLGEIN